MTQNPEQVIVQGAVAWNKWQEQNKSPVHFARPHWYDCRNANGIQVKGRNKLDFSGMHLANASIQHAFSEGLNFRNAKIVDCHFEEGDFSRADFSGTTFMNTKFNKTIFTDSVFAGSAFHNCNLNRVNLANANFCVKEIVETVVYGVSAWDLKTNDEMKQSNLIIEKTYELYSDIIARGQIPLMVDDIELAQFVYYLSRHKKMRNMINILNSKGALLLGQFKDGGLDRLYKLRDWLKARNYIPMIFDFDRPDSLDYTETVITMAGLSKVIFADLSGESVPQELHATMTNFQKPVITYSQKGAYSMFKDLKRKNPYAFELEYTDEQDLFSKMENTLKDVERSHLQIIQGLAETYANRSST
jgi:hypothetical protein